MYHNCDNYTGGNGKVKRCVRLEALLKSQAQSLKFWVIRTIWLLFTDPIVFRDFRNHHVPHTLKASLFYTGLLSVSLAGFYALNEICTDLLLPSNVIMPSIPTLSRE